MSTRPARSARDARWAAVRAGLSRGWIETRQTFVEPVYIISYLIVPAVYAGVLLMMRAKDSTVPGTEFALAAMVLPSLVGMSIAFGGLSSPASVITADREDGTLLRAKAIPNGMTGYLVGKIVMFALTTLAGLLLLVIPGITVAGDLVFDARSWLLLSLIFVVGMMATVPIGVALGSLMKSSLQAVLVPFLAMVLIGVSGIFYPLSALPTWLQWTAQAFPFYWLGLGARSAMLPPELVQAEVGGSWRTLEMFAVLGAWAVAGLLLAPVVLRRMARRQSGSTVAAVRERVMAKGY